MADGKDEKNEERDEGEFKGGCEDEETQASFDLFQKGSLMLDEMHTLLDQHTSACVETQVLASRLKEEYTDETESISKDIPMSNMKLHISNITNVLSSAVQEGAKMAGAKAVNKASAELLKSLIEKAGVPSPFLEGEPVDSVLEVLSPTLVMFLCEMFSEQIPGSEHIIKGCKYSFASTSMDKLSPLLMKLRPSLEGLSTEAKKIIDAEVISKTEKAQEPVLT